MAKKGPTASRSRKNTPGRPLRRRPETLRLRTVMPALTVSDIETSVSWYRDVMGFIVTDEWTSKGRLGGATLKAGKVEFHLIQDDFARGRRRKKGEGVRLYCSTAQNLDLMAADIKARGGVLAQEPTDRPWGTRDFAVVDPDGFKITITAGQQA